MKTKWILFNTLIYLRPDGLIRSVKKKEIHINQMLKHMKITAEEFDRLFDENEVDVIQYLDLSGLRQPNQERKTINTNHSATKKQHPAAQ